MRRLWSSVAGLLLIGIMIGAAIMSKTVHAQSYPSSFSNFNKPLTYFWDSRTNLCFAYWEIDNRYGNPMALTITNVPCTEAVRRVINNKPFSLDGSENAHPPTVLR